MCFALNEAEKPVLLLLLSPRRGQAVLGWREVGNKAWPQDRPEWHVVGE